MIGALSRDSLCLSLFAYLVFAAAVVEADEITRSLHILVHHAKSRNGGRAVTNGRRVGASRIILSRLKQDFQDEYFVLMGDFNDNPDDQSLNILESGDEDARSEMENEPGPFLINLTESLRANDAVTHGRSWNDVEGEIIDVVQPGSREKNFVSRYSNEYDSSVDVLFDQILVPTNVDRFYVRDSVRVFSHRLGVSGRGDARASDHLPVVADFVFPEHR